MLVAHLGNTMENIICHKNKVNKIVSCDKFKSILKSESARSKPCHIKKYNKTMTSKTRLSCQRHEYFLQKSASGRRSEDSH